QRLSQVFFLMLLILLDLVENPADQCTINIRDRLHRDIWRLHRTQNIIDHANTAKCVVADLSANYWYWILFESKEKIATLLQVQYSATPHEYGTRHTAAVEHTRIGY